MHQWLRVQPPFILSLPNLWFLLSPSCWAPSAVTSEPMTYQNSKRWSAPWAVWVILQLLQRVFPKQSLATPVRCCNTVYWSASASSSSCIPIPIPICVCPQTTRMCLSQITSCGTGRFNDIFINFWLPYIILSWLVSLSTYVGREIGVIATDIVDNAKSSGVLSSCVVSM